MQVPVKTINEIGLAEIHAFLAERHIKGGDHFDASMLRAWGAQAEFSLAEGNDAGVEIKSWDTVSGWTETFTVSDAGIDTEWVEIDE